MANYGFKVSLPGYDVSSATDRQLALTSKYETMKIAVEGSWNITIAASTMGAQEFTLAHGLSYVPSFMVFGISSIDNESRLLPSAGIEVETGFEASAMAKVDSTNLIIRLQYFTLNSGIQLHLKYYLFANKLE